MAEFGSYIPGTEYKLFEMDGERFATTICWENLFPDLVRQFVKKGARFIVNITNEAWFGETAAPEQFLSMNVFRAVENGVYVVRCANTGISCFIDPCGRVVDRVKNEEGKDVFVSGFLTGEVVPLSPNTFYTRYGDWFPWLCIIVSAGFILAAIFPKREKNTAAMIRHQEKIASPRLKAAPIEKIATEDCFRKKNDSAKLKPNG